ncbi:MAG UNVERIFIED_CONTAM: metal ABC transporter ATP-binding protein [Rickettsiaceae bacterium]
MLFENISHNYNSYNVLEGVTFDIKRGSITTLVGPNGAGKTTIAKLLLGILKPTSGKIVNHSKKLAYVPQRIALNHDLPLTISSFLELLSPDYKDSKMLDDLMSFARIDQLSCESIQNLSGGQLQRIMTAAALLQSPELLVLDEPTQSLDIDGQEEFYSILAKVRGIISNYYFHYFALIYSTVMKKSDEVLCLNHHLCCRGRPTHTIVKGLENVGIYAHKHDHSHR